jgi:hypothetical protein
MSSAELVGWYCCRFWRPSFRKRVTSFTEAPEALTWQSEVKMAEVRLQHGVLICCVELKGIKSCVFDNSSVIWKRAFCLEKPMTFVDQRCGFSEVFMSRLPVRLMFWILFTLNILLEHLILRCSTLLHCVDLTFSNIFSVYVHLCLPFSLLLFIANEHYMFRPNWPSSSVRVGIAR